MASGAERCSWNLGFQAWPPTASDSLRCSAAASEAPSAPSFRHGDRMTVSCQAAQRSACAPCAVACALLRRRERRGQWPPGQLNWPARHGPRLLLTDLSGPQITQHRPFVAERKCPSSPNHKGLARRDRCDKRGRPARKGLRNVRHADTGSTSLEADLVALAAVLERRSVELDCGFEACKGPHLASHCVQMQVGRPRQSVHVAFALQARRRGRRLVLARDRPLRGECA